MVFTSVAFVFGFLPIVLALHAALWGVRVRNLALLVASLVFYAFGSGPFVLVLVGTTVVDWWLGRAIARARAEGRERRTNWLLGLSIAGNVAVLCWFKYVDFFLGDIVGPISTWLGGSAPAVLGIALPIGISFFTFQRMSYVIDVARGRVEPLERLSDLLLYVALFPQLIAGPIVRFHDLREQLLDRTTDTQRFAAGAVRFAHGFAKKVLIADTVAVVVDVGFGMPPSELTFAAAWLSALAFTVQLYFDFSGYSDMAIGLGSMFGFTLPENFRRPFSSISLTDFWRRWHITLSEWFRDYLYVPLGGSRRSAFRTYLNLVLVFLLVGLWHGAARPFVAFGALHGLVLVIERATGQRPTGDDPVRLRGLRRAFTFGVLVLTFVVFRSASILDAIDMYAVMFNPVDLKLSPELLEVVDPAVLAAMAIGLATVFLPGDLVFGRRLVGGLEALPTASGTTVARLRPRVALGQVVTVVAVFGFALVEVLSRTFRPFLYFQF